MDRLIFTGASIHPSYTRYYLDDIYEVTVTDTSVREVLYLGGDAYSAGTAYVRQSGGGGYTGHEHLTAFGLVNMNARLYDPLTARFLSPDNLVQAPALGQNYNRYSYCLNNPLKYVDKDGNLWWLLFAITDTFSNILKHGLNISQYNYKKTIYSCQRL
jgi:RHS repeat-associated protein